MSWKKQPMKFPGTCIVCNENIPVNEIGLWAKGLGVKHEKCIQANERNIPDGTVLPKNFTLEDTGVFKIINDSKIIKEQQSKIENYFKKSSSKSGLHYTGDLQSRYIEFARTHEIIDVQPVHQSVGHEIVLMVRYKP